MSTTYSEKCWADAEILVRESAPSFLAFRTLKDCKKKPIVAWRERVVAALRDKGYSFPQIADALGMDHTTILLIERRRARGQPAS